MAENVSTPTLGEIQDLKKRLRASEYLGNEYQKTIANLLSENDALKGNIEQLKDTHLQHLQCSGQLCAKNCALSAILWICQQKLGVSPCGLQLLLLLSKYESGPTIEPENHTCHKLIMEIFIKCGIVAIAAQLEYPSELYAKLRVIHQVWNRLMTTDGSVRVMILGREISVAEDKVHSVVCDLDLKTSDGSVTFYDPQKDEGGNGNQEDFVGYVTKDEGLILYTVNLERLNEIIKKYEHILHHTSQPNQALTTPSLPQAQ